MPPRSRLFLAALAVSFAGAAAAEPAGPAPVPPSAPRAGLALADLDALLRVGAPQVSPDGLWVAYTLARIEAADDRTVSSLWMTSWTGQEDLQLTYGKTSVSNPRWSPDGRWLAFTSDREGEAKGAQVWVLDRRGGEARQLTNVKERLLDYRWSPDSRRLLLQLVVKDQPEPEAGAKPIPPKPLVLDRYRFKEDVDGYLTDRRPHLYLFDIASRSLAKLTQGPISGPGEYAEEAGEWSPDGASIAFVSNQTVPDPDRGANSDVFVTRASAGSVPRRLTQFTGVDAGPLVWTPDGRRILFHQGVTPSYSIYDQRRLALVPAAGGATTGLAPLLDQWVGGAVLAPGAGAALTTVADDRQEYVAQISLDGKGGGRRLTTASGSASGLSTGGGHVALVWSADTTAPEIYALEGGALRPLTHHNDALVSARTLIAAKDVSARTPDGVEVHGLLTLPPASAAGSRPPLLLRIHGGPTSQDAHGFNVERQMFVGQGYAVLNVNYRGSTGRGRAYSEAISADWGDKEVKDLLAAVDAVAASGAVDPERVGVGGWSYGGILTDYLIASSGRFKAASSGAGMGNLLGLYGVDEYILQYEAELGPPWKNLPAYLKLSYPFLHADRIKTPTLFMGGDKDFNVPLAGGEQMYQALKSLGVPAELIVYPGEFHGFTRPSFIKDRYQRWFAWYGRYLAAPGAAAPQARGD